MVNHSLFDEKINHDDFLKQSSKLDVSFRAIFSNTDTCLILNDNKETRKGSGEAAWVWKQFMLKIEKDFKILNFPQRSKENK